MKSVLSALVVLLVASSATAASIDDVAWLAGCWAADNREAGSVEQWMRPAGGAMLGMTRVLDDGRIVGFEFLRIVETDDDSLVLFAQPGGDPAVRFDLFALNDGLVTFENPRHDFPQRITYQLKSETQLLGMIEGSMGGQQATFEFPMTRTSC